MYFLNATKEDIGKIRELYHAAIGSPGCTWSQDYPNEDDTMGDFERNDLFCLKNDDGEIIGAISIDDDELVESLSCWDKSLRPVAELSRLVVKEEYRNQGIARQLLTCGMQELEKRGYKGAHFLVSKNNERALRSYAKLDFHNCGESDLYDGNWWCYEKDLTRRI